MSELVVLTFDDTHQAGEAFEALKKIEHSGRLTIDDSAVIVKDENGKIHLQNQLDKGVKWGAVGGGALGLMLASVFFPLAGIAIGAALGALIGKSMDLGVDQKFVKDVTAALAPGTSALFVLGRGDPAAVRSTLAQFQGTVYQSTLDGEKLDQLKKALKDHEK